jgi:hypothetical protein
MATRKKKRNRLFVDEIATVGLVDKGDDPQASIVFLKREQQGGGVLEKDRNLALESALFELQDKVSDWMHARQGRPGPVSRDVGTARVLAAEPDLHAKIERLAAADALHKSEHLPPQVERRKAADGAVTELSRALAPGDPRLGLRLVAKHFPKLHARWLGVES